MRMTAFLILFFFVSVSFGPPCVAGAEWLGQVSSEGGAEVFVSGGWAKVGNMYPVAAGSRFRTLEAGGLSFLMRDGTRVELGEMSEAVVNATDGGRASVSLVRGRLGVKAHERACSVRIPGDISVCSTASDTVGGVYYDRSKGQITCESGSFEVIDHDGKKLASLGAGESFVMDGAGAFSVVPTASIAPATGLGAGKTLAVIGAVAGVGAIGVAASSGDNDASPSVP